MGDYNFSQTVNKCVDFESTVFYVAIMRRVSSTEFALFPFYRLANSWLYFKGYVKEPV